ncbi:hypothetical protein ACFWVK_01905, partial [Streptomyces sp. NPDC058667]
GITGTATTGPGIRATSSQSMGLWASGGGNNPGVKGEATTGPGILGTSTHGPGVTGTGGGSSPGISGGSAQGPGVAGTGGGSSPGITGTATTGPGIRATSSQSMGLWASGGGNNPGVKGEATTGPGILGTSTHGPGVTGTGGGSSPGISGGSAQGPGVAGTGGPSSGVFGKSRDREGLLGVGDSYVGVRGVGGGGYEGVRGEANPGPGVMGSSPSVAVWGEAPKDVQSIGVFGRGQRAFVADGALAADLFGDVYVNGMLTDAGGGFTIDHPLAPESRSLTHSVVGSSERKNVYDGTVRLDGNGRAVVELPEWFEALNEDFRYQLTAIGGPASELHISQPLTENCFTIAGGDAQLEVSWQITGVRRDAWARVHPLVEDREKPGEERGRYLHPELHGQRAEEGLAAGRLPQAPPSPKEPAVGSSEFGRAG